MSNLDVNKEMRKWFKCNPIFHSKFMQLENHYTQGSINSCLTNTVISPDMCELIIKYILRFYYYLWTLSTLLRKSGFSTKHYKVLLYYQLLNNSVPVCLPGPFVRWSNSFWKKFHYVLQAVKSVYHLGIVVNYFKFYLNFLIEFLKMSV